MTPPTKDKPLHPMAALLGLRPEDVRKVEFEFPVDRRARLAREIAQLLFIGGVMAGEFVVKDSGDRQQFAGGMMRDTAADKTMYELVFDGPLVERLARHLTLGAKKYAARNWMLAAGQPELDRFRASAVRHMIQWLRGDQDEDHFAAVVFNLNGYEYVQARMEDAKKTPSTD